MNRKVLKDFSKYVSLNVLGMIGLSCYILADTFFISNKLGANGLAALNFALPIYCVINGAGLMLGIGGGSRFSIFKAQGDEHGANTAFTGTIHLAIALGIAFVLCGLLLASPIASVLGATGEAHAMTATYLQVILYFSPFFILNNIIIAFVRNDGSPKLSMAAMLTGSVSNIILDWVFMYPFSMGIFGAVFATGLSPIISLLVLSVHFFGKKTKLRLVRMNKKRPAILPLGFSSLITELSNGAVLFVFNIVILRLSGNEGVAAYGIVANLALVATAIFTGIAQGIQPLVSRSHGKGEGAKALLVSGIILSTVLSLIIYTISVAFSNELIAIFNSNGNISLKELATVGIRIYFIGFFISGINIILSSYLSATEKVRSALIIAVSRGFAVLLPTVLLLSFSMEGVWISFPLTEIITLVIYFICKCIGSRRTSCFAGK